MRAAYVAYHSNYGGQWPEELQEPKQQWAFAELTARSTAESLADCHPICCDPPMVDLIAAAADTHPPEPFVQHHLPAPDGIALFAKPLPAVWRDVDTGAESVERISAISWGTAVSTKDAPVLSVVAWRRHTGVVHYADPEISVFYPGLRTQSYAVGLFGAPPADQGGPAGPNRILQTLTALCRTPLIREDTSPGSRSARQRAARAGLADPAIRRIYLRRPEHGQAELDAARSERAGRVTRGHWVRGHWKRQWFGSIEEHRTIWIEGYPRGDFTRGTITGTKALIASDRAQRPSSHDTQNDDSTTED